LILISQGPFIVYFKVKIETCVLQIYGTCCFSLIQFYIKISKAKMPKQTPQPPHYVVNASSTVV